MGQGNSGKLTAIFTHVFTGRWRKAIGLMLIASLLLFWITPLPDPLFGDPYATTVRSHEGLLLSASIARDQQWRFPPSDSVPKKFEVAIQLFEDEYFEFHPGINPISILRASSQNIRAGEVVSGGSTLSMQTVRMALKNQSRTYLQKLLELLSTLKLEILYSKETILRTYADHAPFGGNIVGINAASWRYFGRSPHQLSWAETATLAILPNDPASIFPGKNQQKLLEKRNRLLHKIHERGYLSLDELFLSKEEKLPGHIRQLPDLAYHLLHRSIREGHEGTNVLSTLDAQLQVEASRMVHRHSRQMAANQIHNAAALILDLKSGKALAYVGNTNNPGDHGQHVDVITAARSPGSLLKPFLYATAMDEGLIYPRQLLPDIPIFYKGFAPKNFDKEYRGAVPANEALTSSLNVPFVHLLIEYGYEKFHHKMQQIGFASFNKPASHYGLSIVLGGAETSLWEISSVYAGLARSYQNFLVRPIGRGYSKSDFHGNYYIASQEPSAMSSEADGFIRAPSIGFAFEAMQKLQRPDEESGWEFFTSTKPVAWKTGTSFGFRDAWAIGLNDQYLVAVWIGNADGEGRPGLTGIKAAAPLLFELFDLVGGKSIVEENFGAPKAICAESGMRAHNNCNSTVMMQLPEYMNAESSCSFHQLINLDENEIFQVNSSCYPVAKMKHVSWFVLPPVQSWYYQKYHPSYQKLPEYLINCDDQNANRLFDLIYPRQFTKVQIPVEQDGQPGYVIFEATHENTQALLYWHLDDEYLGATQRSHQMGIRTIKGPHKITLMDENGDTVIQNFEVIN